MRRFWSSRGLAVVLAALFLGSWAIQAWAGWREFEAEQETLGTSAEVFGASGYIWMFLQSTMENWQSEFLQLLAFVVLTSFLIFKGSPESRDGQDEMMATLKRIERRLDTLETHNGMPSPRANGRVTQLGGGTASPSSQIKLE
jgi:hypothetical protein